MHKANKREAQNKPQKMLTINKSDLFKRSKNSVIFFINMCKDKNVGHKNWKIRHERTNKNKNKR
jgi:hypothetical protein